MQDGPVRIITGLSMDDLVIENVFITHSGWLLKKAPAARESIKKLTSQVDFKLPQSYLQLLAISDGTEGDLGIEPGWFQLWEAEKVAENNQDYCVNEFLPGFWGFGGNGGGELFAFRMNDGEPYAVYLIPFIPMEEKRAVLIADSFDSFILFMGKEWNSI